GLVPANPCERGGKLYRASRADKIWTADDEANFLAKAPPHLHLPLKLGIWTGQREGDLLRLPILAYDGEKIRLLQRKSGARNIRVVIPVSGRLKARPVETAVGRRPPDRYLLPSGGPEGTSAGSRRQGAKLAPPTGG